MDQTAKSSTQKDPDPSFGSDSNVFGSGWKDPFPESAGPRQIGKYHIIGTVASGGQGTVYEAVQESPRRTVALKVIKAGLASPQMLRRFELETQVLGRLQHPGIGQIYEAGTADSGAGPQPYFAMEFIDGPTLIDYAEAYALDSRERLDLMVKVCQAVHYAHQKGVIHRDLKPGNILVDPTGRPKILDFGVARSLDTDLHAVTVQTDIGQLVGTIPYMSPEQVLADPDELDIRSDVYALGVVTYELLAGSLPYDLRQMAIFEAIEVIRESEPVPLSALDRTLRGDVETIVAKALEKEKVRRYQSAAEFAADMERFLRNEPILARPPSTFYQLSKYARRNKVLMGGIVATFMALLLGLVGTGYGLVRSTEQRDRALAAEEAASERQAEAENEAAKVRAINEFLLQDLFAAPDPWADGRSIRVVDILDRAAEKVGTAFADQPEISGALRQTLGSTYRGLALYDAAEPLLADAYAFYRMQKGDDHPDTLAALHDWGGLYLARDEFNQAEEVMATVVKGRARILGDDHPDTLLSMRELSTAIYRQGKYAECESLLREIRETCRRVYGSDHRETLLTVQALGWALLRTGDLTEAEECFQLAEAGFRRVHGEDHPRTIAAMNGLATVYMDLWQTERAEPYYRRTLEASRRVFGDDHPDTVVAIIGLGNLLKRVKDFDEAETLYREALEIYRRRLGDEHQYTLIAVNNLAGLLANMRRFDEAESLHTENLERRRRLLGENHPDVAESLEAMGNLYFWKGDYEEAASAFTNALKVLRSSVEGDHPDVTNVLANLAAALRRMGDLAAAEPVLREVVAMGKRIFGPSNPMVLGDMQTLLSVLLKRSKYSDAEKLGRELLALVPEESPPNARRGAVVSSLLGEALAAQGRLEEAEPLLLAGARLRDDPEANDRVKLEALERLVKLYQDWGKPEQAAKWQR